MQNNALELSSQNENENSLSSFIKPHLGKWSIDSCKLWIPFHNVEILDQSIFDTKLVISQSTGELESTFKTNAAKIHEDGIKTKYCYLSMPYKDQDGSDQLREYIVVLFNSKLLKERYFAGISERTIKDVYIELMKHEKVVFTYEDFLNSTLTDTDWKCDVMLGEDGYERMAKFLKSNTKDSRKLGSGYHEKNSQTNRGIQFSTRQNAVPSRPFFKLYAKAIELRNNSPEFLPSLFGSHSLENLAKLDGLYRLEFTVKNSNFYQAFNLGERSLTSALNWSEDKVKALSRSIIMKHLISEPRVKAKQSEKMKPMDRLFLGLLEDMVNRDKSIKRMYQIIDETFDSGEPSDRKAKSTYKSKFEKLYAEHFENLKKCQVSEVAQNAAEYFGIGDEFLKS